MAKKKSEQAPGDEGKVAQGVSPSTSAPVIPQVSGASAGESKKNPKSPRVVPPISSHPTLIICRNKHWRYISAFQGPWHHMPIEILETISNINYNTLRPRPIDPAVLFDLVKIRRLVDEATNLAVRAASDIASPILTNVNGGLPAFGNGGHGAKLSRERKFRMREQASQKLGRAYRLDEIACSVATMQGASPLEYVSELVLHRNPHDSDAMYANFFFEKIPSRQLAAFTSLQPLTEIISERPTEGEALRTRAMVKSFKNDCEGAAQDLTLALSVYRSHQQPHIPTEEELRLRESHRSGRRPQDVILAEKDQPSSLEGQLLFQRATAYLTLAYQHVIAGVPSPQGLHGHVETVNSDEYMASESGRGSPDWDKELPRKQVESRKLVKTYAKRAVRDYISFISQFEYAPNLPVKVAKDFGYRINHAARGIRNPRSSEPGSLKEPHAYYPLSDLFAAVPPSNLPAYPSQDLPESGTLSPPLDKTCEYITYHPLLTDALHSLLLCHCLIQTSAKELLRHANMVARLVRLADGYPIFQASRSTARSDWIDVIRRAENWLQLSASWETLCLPAPLPMFDVYHPQQPGPSPSQAASAAAAMLNGESVQDATQQRRQERTKERIREHAILDALDDERVYDEESFRAAVEAREKHAEEDGALFGTDFSNPIDMQTWLSAANAAVDITTNPANQRSSTADPKEYPILTERAAAIAHWVREAPVVTGTTKRKKRTKKPGKEEGLDAMGKLGLETMERGKS
ncbi:hypothetical protein G7Z17_g11262 [Cylindrodendrum hubeiense]|uniref:Histidine kinase group protein n=1 Tax=Cylindrodendrum hubeiense TaxID=595255 RepID=A0A9P5LBH8_9HYPO|nr:hypothetical protein G7Z17_g11262 [Cylindrodendrum hubeiense]